MYILTTLEFPKHNLDKKIDESMMSLYNNLSSQCERCSPFNERRVAGY